MEQTPEGLTDGLTTKCASMDKPIAALVKDLKARGLLDETLIIWAVNLVEHHFVRVGLRQALCWGGTTTRCVHDVDGRRWCERWARLWQ